MPTHDKPQNEEVEERTEPHFCPRCSWEVHTQIPKPHNEEMQEYMRGVLAMPPRMYIKAYSLLGGMVTLRLRQLDEAERQGMGRLLQELHKAELPLDQSMLSRINAFYALDALVNNTEESPMPIVQPLTRDERITGTLDTYNMIEERLGALPVPIVEAIFATTTMFMRLEMGLRQSILQDDFWKGAGYEA